MIPIKYKKALKGNATELRKNMTPEERKLWYEFLRQYPYQFRRQKPFGSFIADFYCARAKIVVELDGRQHLMEEVRWYDEERTAYLNSLGLEVIRIANKDIHKNFLTVCEYIDRKVKARIEQ